MSRLRTTLAGLLAAASVSLLAASGAGAAVVLGAPEFKNIGEYAVKGTLIQTESPGNRYIVPADGVITSWGKWAASDPKEAQRLKLKVARNAGGWRVIGESALETFSPTLNAHQSFPTRISVKQGDAIGIYSDTERPDVHKAEGYFVQRWYGADIPAGDPRILEPGINYLIVVDASLEPDVDLDGYGDETQDQCVGVPGPTCFLAPPPAAPPKAKPLKCKKGFKKVKVKGKPKCRRVKKHPHHGKAKGGN